MDWNLTKLIRLDRCLLSNLLLTGLLMLANGKTEAQVFYFGNDLSYVNQMEDCGAVFKEQMQPKDVYQIFADHGTNLVRVRLWIDPSWWQGILSQPAGVKAWYNDIEDVKETIRRSRSAGMQVMLDIHYSDFWADPGRQLIPRGWLDAANEVNRLRDSVYAYTFSTMTRLDSEGLMPDMVKIGNETNGGILNHIPEDNGFGIKSTVSNSWERHGILFNAAIKAVRDAGSVSSINPKIAVHFTNSLSGQVGNFRNLIDIAGVTDFDIIGISYYYAWHQGNVRQLESTIRSLVSTFPGYEVMVVETGYLWTTRNFDQLGNIVNVPDPEYLPVTPEKQLEYLVDYTRAVMKGGGTGVIFWEPAWVSTPCRTPWGVGSSHDHLVFFDPVHTNLMENGGGMWMQSPYYKDLTTIKTIFKVDMTGQDTTNGVYISGSFSDKTWEITRMASEGNSIFSHFTYLKPSSEGGYFFLNGNNPKDRETVPSGCANYQDTCRRYKVYTNEKVIGYKWGTCESITGSDPDEVEVTFSVNMAGQDVSRGVYITGHITGDPWKIVKMARKNDSIYFHQVMLQPGQSGAYYYLTTSTWTNYLNYRETVPADCARWWNSDRGYVVPEHDTVIAVYWGSCKSFTYVTAAGVIEEDYRIDVYPNPAEGILNIRLGFWMETPIRLELLDTLGHPVLKKEYADNSFLNHLRVDVSYLPGGLYFLKLMNPLISIKRKIILR